MICRKHLTRIGVLTALATTGLLAALTLATQPARAYSITQLVNMGFGVVFISTPVNGCHDWKIGWHNDNKTYLGSDCDPGFQARLDAYLAANCPPAVCGGQTETVTTATTDEWTTTESSTVTLPGVTIPAVTVPVAVTTPDDDPAPPADIEPSPPSARFTASSNGLDVNASDQYGNTDVTWGFGDGANGAGPDVSHRYASPGDYVIVETVVADGLVAQSAETVHVTTAAEQHTMAMLVR